MNQTTENLENSQIIFDIDEAHFSLDGNYLDVVCKHGERWIEIKTESFSFTTEKQIDVMCKKLKKLLAKTK